MKTPDYVQRLEKEKRTSSKCINCLLETEERINAGDFDNVSLRDALWYKTYFAETEELKKVLRKYHPEKIIEVGSGSGRVIKTVLDVLPSAMIVGTEINNQTFNFVKQRFSINNNVTIVNTDIADYLCDGEEQDMAICLMNTFGNINDAIVFRQIVKHSRCFVFSLYNRQFDAQRELMYLARGHTDFKYDANQYCFNDEWVKGLVSRSYTAEEINELVISSGSEIKELKTIGLLYFAITERKNSLEII